MEAYKNKILEFYRKHKRMPVYREIMVLIGFKSKNAVYKLVAKLVEEGIVEKDKSGKLIPKNLFGEVSVLGLVKAGFPSPGEEQILDTMSLDDFLIEKKEATYLLEVDGDSMIDAHIAHGDLVIAECTNTAKDGEIVIAEVDGEWTMKYYREKSRKSMAAKGGAWLEAANKNYKPIYPTEELKIAAVVRGVIRKYK